MSKHRHAHLLSHSFLPPNVRFREVERWQWSYESWFHWTSPSLGVGFELWMLYLDLVFWSVEIGWAKVIRLVVTHDSAGNLIEGVEE